MYPLFYMDLDWKNESLLQHQQQDVKVLLVNLLDVIAKVFLKTYPSFSFYRQHLWYFQAHTAISFHTFSIGFTKDQL